MLLIHCSICFPAITYSVVTLNHWRYTFKDSMLCKNKHRTWNYGTYSISGRQMPIVSQNKWKGVTRKKTHIREECSRGWRGMLGKSFWEALPIPLSVKIEWVNTTEMRVVVVGAFQHRQRVIQHPMTGWEIAARKLAHSKNQK